MMSRHSVGKLSVTTVGAELCVLEFEPYRKQIVYPISKQVTTNLHNFIVHLVVVNVYFLLIC